MLIFRERALKAGVNLFFVYDTLPSGLRLFADASRIQQIIVHFLTNAIRATPPKGRVTLRMDLKPLEPDFDASASASATASANTSSNDGEESDLATASLDDKQKAKDNSSNKATGKEVVLSISVSDTGIGISAEDQSRLFRPFMLAERRKAAKRGKMGAGESLTGGPETAGVAVAFGTLAFGILHFGIWHFGIWHFGIWYFGIWHLAYGIWHWHWHWHGQTPLLCFWFWYWFSCVTSRYSPFSRRFLLCLQLAPTPFTPTNNGIRTGPRHLHQACRPDGLPGNQAAKCSRSGIDVHS